MPRRPHGVHPRRREADARASFGPISAHKYLEATERARSDNTAQRQLPRSDGCGLLQRRTRVERVLHSRRAPQRAHAIHRRKRQEPVKPTARARPRTRAHVASAYDEPSLLGGHPHALDGVAPTASNNPEALLICIMPNEERLYLGLNAICDNETPEVSTHFRRL